MDEFTPKNAVLLRGTALREPEFSHENHGERFLRFPLQVQRLSRMVRAMLNLSRIEAGERTADGEEITLPVDPGQRVSMMDGVALWQRDLLEYGTNQGFTMGSAS